ncbi:hypothetical protein FXO37_27633 [Capsicum annuum]|nr:hypothetical protein FXO37_27633 [Capsicum annuum]
MCVADRRDDCNNLRKVINASNEGDLVVSEDTLTLDVFEMDTAEVIISHPHHKHVDEDQVYLTIFVLKSVMKDYAIREKFQTQSKRSSKKTIGFQSFAESTLAIRFLQDPLKETPENDNQSPEVTLKAVTIDNEAKESPKKLIEKLSDALVNVSAKEDLVKQHAKVAEKFVAGVAEQSADPDRNINKQFSNKQDVDAAEQNANQDGNANEQSPNDHDVGVAEQSADPDGDTDEQVPNEQDVGATEQNADQYGDANEQVSDE